MFGGKIIIRPRDMRDSCHNVVMGNTVLYGATGGEFYGAGKAGERFAVRNSGAAAVVEGTGHHLCEYMTEGLVIVLGDVGFNIGAGMTGGVLYIYDDRNMLRDRMNGGYVTSRELKTREESEKLKTFLEKFYQYTASIRAGTILDSFESSLKYFRKIVPVGNR
jgi:glutamate synthase (NADPH/NADH) large chain